MKKYSMTYYEEPKMEFAFSQSAEDCRDGLTVFGPYQQARGSVRIGVIGTNRGLFAYSNFSSNVNKPVFTESAGRPFFPGFKAVFGLDWSVDPVAKIELADEEIDALLETKNLYERTSKIVSLYLDRINKYMENEETQVDLWYVVIPHRIWLLCRPKSASGAATISSNCAKRYISGQISFFDQETHIDEYMKMYSSDPDFHDQLKARILAAKISAPIQIMLEDTLLFKDKKGEPYSDDMKAHLLWTQCTSTYYKLGYWPWKLHNIRKGVCYIGLVFKTLQDHQKRKGYACCAAQMFLDNGDGMIFRGNNGPWRSKNEKTYHLNTEEARALIQTAVNAYRDNIGSYPTELFIHGRTFFSDEEWLGFAEAVSECENINIVGITINEGDGLRIYKDTYNQHCEYGVLRGLALKVDAKAGYLWTKGFIPRTETTNHMEIARPLKISISRGECDLDTVMRDILCLTKLNYNACLYGDGLPVTLRFSDKIGNILTAIKDVRWPAKQFKYYI
jgi:hypothetical protein